MNADADAQRLAQVAAQPVIELVEPLQHFPRTANSVCRPALGIGGIKSVQSHQPVASELRIVSVACGESLSHLVKKLIENE